MPEITPLPPSVTPQACDRERWVSRVVWIVLMMLLSSFAHENAWAGRCAWGVASGGKGRRAPTSPRGKQEQGEAQQSTGEQPASVGSETPGGWVWQGASRKETEL